MFFPSTHDSYSIDPIQYIGSFWAALHSTIISPVTHTFLALLFVLLQAAQRYLHTNCSIMEQAQECSTQCQIEHESPPSSLDPNSQTNEVIISAGPHPTSSPKFLVYYSSFVLFTGSWRV